MSSFLVSTNFAFSGVFLVKKTDKWSDMWQLAYGVGNCSKLAWMITMGMPTCLQKLGSFEKCSKLDHVQRRVHSDGHAHVGNHGRFGLTGLEHGVF